MKSGSKHKPSHLGDADWVCVFWQGINYLVEKKLLDGRAQSIAEFLYKEEGLNKTAIGEFLGER